MIDAVIAQYKIPGEDFRTLRATGATLCGYGYESRDLNRQQAMLTEGVSYLKQSVECMEGDALERIATLRLLAPKYTWIDQQPEAIVYYDQAYDMLSNLESEDLTEAKSKELNDIRLDILTAKATAFTELNQPEDALQIYNKARELSGAHPLPGWTLDEITLLFKEEYDTDGTKLMEALHTWTVKERNSWFAYCFNGFVDANAVTRMQRAAKMAKKTDLLLEWLNGLAKTLPKESYYLFNLRGAIARLYYPVMGCVEKGKAMRQEILAMNPKPESWYEETMNETRTQHHMQLAEILFHEFQTCADPAKKETLLESLTLLPSAHVHDDELHNPMWLCCARTCFA
ncbi:hypothetical protein ACJBU6_10122 [Exserohilum turcicum]